MIRTYTLMWLDTNQPVNFLSSKATFNANLPVISPRILACESRRLSNNFRNSSRPWTSVWFAPNKNNRDSEPMKPITTKELICRRRLGSLEEFGPAIDNLILELHSAVGRLEFVL